MNAVKQVRMSARRPTVMAQWLLDAAHRIEWDAEESLPAWIILGQAQRYCEDLGKAAILRKAAGIKSVADRRRFLRANGIAA